MAEISMVPEHHFRFEVVDDELEFHDTPTWCVFFGETKTEAVDFLEDRYSLQPSGTVVEGVVMLSDDREEIDKIRVQVQERGDA